MKLIPQELEKIANLTLEHYDQDAEEFWRDDRFWGHNNDFFLTPSVVV